MQRPTCGPRRRVLRVRLLKAGQRHRALLLHLHAWED